MEYKFSHLGVNNVSVEDAQKTASILRDAFGMSLRQGHGYIFADQSIEVREQLFYGQKGHLAYSVSEVEEALEELHQKGIEADYDTAVCNAQGQIISIYLKLELSGFAVHLVRERIPTQS